MLKDIIGVSAPSTGERGKKFEINEELFSAYAANGIDAIEIAMPFGVDLFNLYFDKLEYYADKHGVMMWSYHLPFSNFFDPSGYETSDSMKVFKMLIKRASAAKSLKCAVIHPSAEVADDSDRAYRINTAKKNLSELCDYTGELGIVLAVECLPRKCLANTAEETAEIISANDSLQVCFDVNHVPPEQTHHFAELLRGRIATVHISDCVVPDDHLLPTEGSINWSELMRDMDMSGCSSPFVFEASRFSKVSGAHDMGIYRRLYNKIKAL